MNRQQRRREGRLARRAEQQKRAHGRAVRDYEAKKQASKPSAPVLQIPVPVPGPETEQAVRMAVAKTFDAGIVDARVVYAGLVCGFVVSREIVDRLTPAMLDSWDEACAQATKLASTDQLVPAITALRAQYGV